ncbi:transporter [Pantoea sp. Tr-811]|uniref:transporter n=1 Tax=unclassified Pantoea TaxID=2630326 RepID=UPI00141F8730|nr:MULTISPECIES: transporter [unclassified Pantoea]NIE74077.1 transporter [Pantoea sp. Ap-967]NIF28582.1 transporter [Pantoea sp. Tr-811]
MGHHALHPQQEHDLFGLLYGFSFVPGQPGRELDSAQVLRKLSEPQAPDEFLWLHLNLAHAACERWLRAHLPLPEAFFETLREGSRSTRIEHADSTLLAVVNDVVFNFGMVSSDVSTLWACASNRLLVSARLQPLHSVDKLRSSVKHGERFHSPIELLVHLLRDQGDLLTQIVRETTTSVDRIEDQLLSQRLSDNRAELSSMRRVLVRLQRLLALEPGALLRLLNRPPEWLQDQDMRQLRAATEEFTLVISDLTALGERIKLLQEEIAAKLNEQTNRTLFTLTVVTVLALPINIIAGFFGMNVGGVPLADDPNGFWLLVALVATFTFLAGRWAFSKRREY